MLAKENPQLLDAFSQEAKKSDSVYNRVLNMEESGVMGALEIPKISLYLPIYHGTSQEVLEKGIGHLEGSQEAKKSDSAYNRVLNMEESGFNRASEIAECRTFF